MRSHTKTASARGPARLAESLLANGRIDLIVRPCAGIQQPGGRIARGSRRAARRCAEEPAVIRVRAERITVSLGRHRPLPGAGSTGPPPDDRNADIIPVVDDDTTVGIGRIGRLPGEVINRRGIAGGSDIVYVDILAIRVDPNPVPHIAAGRAI